MGDVAHAVAEFDEAVRAPWRPPLRAVSAPRGPALHLVHPGGGGVGGAGRPVRPVVRGAVPAVAGGGVAAEEKVAGRRPGSGPAGRGVGGRQPSRSAPVPRAAARPLPGVRLTRRGRRLAVVLAAAVGVAVGGWVDSVASGDGEQLRLVGESSVVVRSGDTLWGIAGAVAGDEDVRAVVQEIQQLNALDGAALVPGQTLRLP